MERASADTEEIMEGFLEATAFELMILGAKFQSSSRDTESRELVSSQQGVGKHK